MNKNQIDNLRFDVNFLKKLLDEQGVVYNISQISYGTELITKKNNRANETNLVIVCEVEDIYSFVNYNNINKQVII